jgi:S1-C subfamily serine protease
VLVRARFPETPVSYEGIGSGSGFVIEDGFVVTNAHVVAGASSISVAAADSDRDYAARLVGLSQCDDLAVLAVDDTDAFEPASLGDSEALEVGDEVIALGYPLGTELDTDVTATSGIVSRLDAELGSLSGLIQTDAAISQGNSGGPLVNRRGEVVGIATLSLSADVANNISFAIPIDAAQPVIDTLSNGENINWLGMNLTPNTYRDVFGTEEGLVVNGVDTGSPADRANLEPADLLLSVEGLTVQNQADVCDVLRSRSAGEPVEIEVLRLANNTAQVLEGELYIGDPEATADAGTLEVTETVATDQVIRATEPAPAEPTATHPAPAEPTATHPAPAEPTATHPAPAEPTAGASDESIIVWDFETDTGEWPTVSEGGFEATIADGTYTVTLNAQNSFFVSPVEITEFSDGAVGARLQVGEGTRAVSSQ